MMFCLLTCTLSPFQKGFTLKGKNLVSRRVIYFPFRVQKGKNLRPKRAYYFFFKDDSIPERCKTISLRKHAYSNILKIVPPKKMNIFRLRIRGLVGFRGSEL